MVIKRVLLFTIIAGFIYSNASAQTDDFCNAINTILRDAPNKFRNVRGKTLQANNNATMWDCSIKVPGTIGSRFVAAMGLYYEGAVFQTPFISEIKAAYEKYKSQLSGCLLPHGYALSTSDNFYAGLGDYKKLIFMLEEKDDPAIARPINPPAHVSMEVTYSKEVGKYTIVIFIFEH